MASKRKSLTPIKVIEIAHKAINRVAAWYPEAVFPDGPMEDTDLVTAVSGRAARLTTENVRREFDALITEERKRIRSKKP